MADKMFDCIVIGGGASGLAAAIEAAREHSGISLAVLRLPRAGKKILATGNGRCNLTNLNAAADCYNNPAFAAPALTRLGFADTLDFFASMGLYTYADSEGRVYPLSNTAASVLDALRFELERLGITLVCDTHVGTLSYDGVFKMSGGYTAEKTILASGGKASPCHGSDGSGYTLLSQLGHNVNHVTPALVQLQCSAAPKAFKGVRCSAGIKIEKGGKCLFATGGEILFTEYGLSGIASMEASGCAAQELLKKSGEKIYAVLDLAPSLTDEDLQIIIKKSVESYPGKALENLLSGVMHKALGMYVCKGVLPYNLDKPCKLLTAGDISGLSAKIKRFPFEINGTKGFENAQLCNGGAAASEFCAETMESLKVPGLYCCGELLDVHAGCGGFNLQWAWSSGRLAGKLMTERQ